MNRIDWLKIGFEIMLYLSAIIVFVYAVLKDKY